MVGARRSAETARAAATDALAAARRRAPGGSRPRGTAPGLLAMQRAAGNAAVNALLSAKVRSLGSSVSDVDSALREIRKDDPAVDTVEKGLRAAKAVGVPVDLEGTKPPPSALAVTRSGFGPGQVKDKKPAGPPKPVPAKSPLGKAGAKKPTAKGGGPGKGSAPTGAGSSGGGGAAPQPAAPLSGEQLLQPPVPPTHDRPEDDPAFTAVTGKVAAVGKAKKAHPPAALKAKEAQEAAEPPSGDLAGQAKAAKADTMDAQQPGGFDKKAFIASVKEAIEAKSPKTLEEADEYKESGKAGEVKGDVKGLVTSGKEGQAKDIETATEAAPDTSKSVPKPVTPMQGEEPGGAPAVAATGAVPKPVPAEQVNLEGGKHRTKGEMEEGDVDEDQLKEERSGEPEFQKALTDKKEADAHADSAPGEFRQQEQQVIAEKKAEASATTAEGMAGIQGSKRSALAALVTDKGKTKSKDEQRRTEVTTKIQSIFDATEADVKKILDGIDPKVDKEFETGEKSARMVFENYVDMKMSAYKRDRYGGWLGGIRWAKDKLVGMPDKVNEFYEAGRELYLEQMDGVISRVANIVGDDLTAAKTRIATGRGQIASYVKTLPADLKKVGSQASQEIGERFDQLESDVDEKQNAVVDTLASKYVEARKGLDERIEALQAENKGLVDKVVGAIKAIVNTIRELAAMLRNVLSRVAGVVKQIIKDPVGFLGNLIAGIKGGILKFKDNILDHLRKGLMSWLFGALAEGGVELPETFDIKGIIKLLASIFGLTWRNIRNRLVKQLGEKAMGALEKGADVFKTLATEGVGGLWQMLVDKLGDIKEMILDKVKDFVVTKVITAGITWLIGLLNPAAAFIKACKLIYDVVMFFVRNASRIAQFVNTVIDSVADVVKGNIGGVINKIDNVLGQMVPIIIGFLASVIGLGGIGEKVRKIVTALQKPVTKALDVVIKTGLKLAGPLIRGLKGIGSKVKKKVAAGKAYVKGKVEAGKAYVKGKAKRVLGFFKKGFRMSAAGHELRVRPGPARSLEMASAAKRPLGALIVRVLSDVEKRKAAVAAAKVKTQELAAKGKLGVRETKQLAALEEYLSKADVFAADVRKIDSIRAQIEASGPETPEREVSRLVTRLTKRLEILGMRFKINDLGPLAPPIDKDVGDVAAFKAFKFGRKDRFGTLEAEHITPGSILQIIIGGWEPGEVVYTRGRAASTSYAQDTTLLVPKRIADIKTDIGSLRHPSDQAEIRHVKKAHDYAMKVWAKADAGQPLTKHEQQSLDGLSSLFNRVVARRVEVTISARDRYIQELRSGQRGGLPPSMSLATTILSLRDRLSDGNIGLAAMDQVGRAWALGKDVTERAPVEET